MWRKDAGRTGVTSMELPERLQLRWVRELPALTPAYHSSRLQFDAGHEPIVADRRVLIASSVTDSLTAYHLETGAELWSFRADGPIRFAPAIWEDSVLVGSDDGVLYCIDLQSGQQRWQYRAVPSERRLLGNRRLISVWPIRGGPVVVDGNVYFAAGVWPFEGVFVYSLDIKTGQLVWRNDSLGYRYSQQPHNTQAIGGLAPQGYLIANGDELIVPCSTAYPAVLDRKTGELIEFDLPSPGRFPGGWFAAIDLMSSPDVRRGKVSFDSLVNRQQHEGKLQQGHGVSGISRKIRCGSRTWQFDDEIAGVDGKVHSLVVADGHLIVSTRQGQIYCFHEMNDTADKPQRWSLSKVDWQGDRPATEFVHQLLPQAASRYGYAFVIGLSDGAIAKALVRESDYHVVAFDDNPQRVEQLRRELERAGLYGSRAAVIECELGELSLPPYLASVITSETPDRLASDRKTLLPSLRPFGGIAALGTEGIAAADLADVPGLNAEKFEFAALDGQTLVRRVGSLPGASQYPGDWQPSPDELVRFPLGVLWFDDTLAHFKRSPQPRFVDGVMISRPKDWHAARLKDDYSVDYPLLPAVLSDIYTGRVLDETEQAELRAQLKPSDPSKPEPSQYRPPQQKDAWKPKQPVVGMRINPLTGEQEPREFPKTYGCDGGVDYGDLYTLRAGTPAFYDKTLESGTVFLSGPRSGCTNSIIPSGGLLNVPYFYEGCTCSYPLPTALSLYSMPESHEQWSSWGDSEPAENSIERLGINFAAPGDRMTRDGTLWLDFPSIGGPSPGINVEVSPEQPRYQYHHSLWMEGGEGWPWIAASSAQGLERLTVHSLRPGRYTVRLYFAEPDEHKAGDRVQDVSVQGQIALRDFDIVAESGGSMRSIVRQFDEVEVDNTLTVELSAKRGETLISGVELIRQP